MKLLQLHSRSINLAMRRIFKAPIENLLNIIVISLIASMLGAILVIAHSNNQWQKNNITYPQIMVYLNENVTADEVSKLKLIINTYNRNIIKDYQYISKEQGLQELQHDNQLKSIASDVMSNANNPLPNILIINTLSTNIKTLSQLSSKIEKLQFVNSVQMDENYARKVSNLINFVNNISEFLLVIFSISLILVIYNQIRLQMLQNRDEITVSRLTGASDSYIMRPLTYFAIFQVTISTIIAFVLINSFIKYLNFLFFDLNTLFGKSFILNQLTILQFGQMLLTLIIFTIFAVLIAVKTMFHNSYTQ